MGGTVIARDVGKDDAFVRTDDFVLVDETRESLTLTLDSTMIIKVDIHLFAETGASASIIADDGLRLFAKPGQRVRFSANATNATDPVQSFSWSVAFDGINLSIQAKGIANPSANFIPILGGFFLPFDLMPARDLTAVLGPGQLVFIGGASVSTSKGCVVTKFDGRANQVKVLPGGSAQVIISGKCTFDGDIDLGASTVTMTDLLNDMEGAGELVTGTGGVDILPMTLVARSGSGAEAATFERFPTGARPSFRLVIENQDPEQGLFKFDLRVDRATILEFPVACLGGLDDTANLTTSFIIDDGFNPPVAVSTVEAWRCGSNDLKTP